ncbi:UDP-N-acetylmuramate--alanine ligase [hydrothermal vent metagenome]|uniref:UDP-N-acetylmuramate--L-alanine ligase n=1 Tax=hydrothermal vent metagenome TaxID=652676 RepID=A0A3B1DXC1_9ZZZZ
MRIHFIGIGGIGLSALARFLKYSGHDISGSDIKSTPITKTLEEENIKINIPQSASAICGQDLIIYSAAITNTNTERLEATRQKLNVMARKEALPIILKDTQNYCVCAAHGKSTTTAMLSSILQSSAIIGAISKEFNSNFRYINNILAFEADESDESFILSNPYCSIVLNTEPEHMEYYNYDEEKFYDAYKKFLDIAPKKVINAEDDFLKKYNGVATKLFPSIDIKNITYLLKDGEPYTKFDLKDFGTFEVWGFGEHIALDASMAILAALDIMDIETIKINIAKYKGIKKRFDIIQKQHNFIVIDDYAHHPTEILATMNSIKLYNNLQNIDKIYVIWQPHKYSRTKDNLELFKICFKGCHKLIILPVWSVSEPILDIDFAKEFQHYSLVFADSIVTTQNKLSLIKDSCVVDTIDDGIVVGVGAGDITYQLR